MRLRVLRSVFVIFVAACPSVIAHHEPLAKFDDKKPVRIRGVVSLVDWRNPHAHIFVNVASADKVNNWAVELESPIDLEANGWSRTTIQPGDKVAVQGLAARDNSRQIWATAILTSRTARTYRHWWIRAPSSTAASLTLCGQASWAASWWCPNSC